MELQHHVDEIREQGFTVLPSLLSPADVRVLKTALEPFLQRQHMGRNNFEGFITERVYALLAKDPAFATIIEHPAILSIVSEFLAPNFLLSAALAINIHADETPQPFHSDATLPNAPHDTTSGISTLWALDEFTEDNGATEVIPGSHRWVDEKPGEDDCRAVKALMPAGSVMVFHGSLFHRGGANHSGAPRLAITPQYCQPWLRQIENMVLAVPPEIASTLSPQLQAMLGYSIREPGFMGYVDGMHPRRVLDPGYRGRKARGLPS